MQRKDKRDAATLLGRVPRRTPERLHTPPGGETDAPRAETARGGSASSSTDDAVEWCAHKCISPVSFGQPTESNLCAQPRLTPPSGRLGREPFCWRSGASCDGDGSSRELAGPSGARSAASASSLILSYRCEGTPSWYEKRSRSWEEEKVDTCSRREGVRRSGLRGGLRGGPRCGGLATGAGASTSSLVAMPERPSLESCRSKIFSCSQLQV